jgi:hypothetical protein
MNWRTLKADGCEWEIRATASGTDVEDQREGAREILEFTPIGQARPPRRIEIPAGALASLSDEDLVKAYRSARPIGGDFYGRPGKRMPDAKE